MGEVSARLRLAAGCHLVDPASYLSILEVRFGMRAAYFTDRFVFFSGGRKYLYCLSAEHRLPGGPELAFSGIKFMRTAMKVPKLTTEAAVAFGDLATRNYVELDLADARAYLAREPVDLEDSQCPACTAAGYVLVRLRGVTLGTGYLREAASAADGPGRAPGQSGTRFRLESWFPKQWAEVVKTG